MGAVFGVFFCMLLAASNAHGDDTLTDTEIRKRMIAESINAYPGNCPCPESRDAAGRRCGLRSAYGRAGGRSVLCHPTDVTDEDITRYRNTH